MSNLTRKIREMELLEALDQASFSWNQGDTSPVKRRGSKVFSYGWEIDYPSARAAKRVARKLVQFGYGPHGRTRSADKKGRFYMRRWRRRLVAAQDELRDYYQEVSGDVPF